MISKCVKKYLTDYISTALVVTLKTKNQLHKCLKKLEYFNF